MSVDVWSTGCIFAEMLSNGFKVLLRGRSALDQIELIVDLVGTPTESECVHLPLYMTRHLRDSPQRHERKELASYCCPNERAAGVKYFNAANAGAEALALLSGMLMFCPTKRLDAEACLRHCYLGDYAWSDEDGRDEDGDVGERDDGDGEEEEESRPEMRKWPALDHSFEDYS
eukprot:gene1043-8512_t